MNGRGSRHLKTKAKSAGTDNQITPDTVGGHTMSTQIRVTTGPTQVPTVSLSTTSLTATTTLSSSSGPTKIINRITSTGTPNRTILNLPAIRFLTRTDFFNVMHMNDEALTQYNSSSSLKHMVIKVRREGQHQITNAFERYQHNRDFILFLNKFEASGYSAYSYFN